MTVYCIKRQQCRLVLVSSEFSAVCKQVLLGIMLAVGIKYNLKCKLLFIYLYGTHVLYCDLRQWIVTILAHSL